jgi:putative acetyltransferase
MIAVAPCAVDHPDALRLIGESEAEQAAIYAPEVRYAFSPEQLVAANVHFIVARINGAAVGCGGMAPLDGYGELKRVFTTRAARGLGVGRAVVAALEAEARRRLLPLMRLETGEASPDALALYAACGYARRGPFGAYVENGSSVFMEKALTATHPETHGTRGAALR